MAALGIDLGKATCSVAVRPLEGGEVFVFHEDPIVALTARDGWVVGAEARRVAVNGGGEAVWDLLELQGRKESDFTTAQLTSWTFGIVRGATGKALVELRVQPVGVVQKIYAPEELLAILFAHVRRRAEQHSGIVVQDVVLTMPACCSYAQRQALRDASTMAGLTVQRMIVSSTAAAIAFGSACGEDDKASADQLLLVVDFGAGCLDASLVSVRGASKFEVKAVAGDASLGGVVLTDRIVEHFIRTTSMQTAFLNPKTRTRLRRASQFAKNFLGNSEIASVQVQTDSGTFTGSITRAHFEYLCLDCWDRIRALVRLVLSEGNTTVDHVEGVLLCGGSSVVPVVHRSLQNMFPGRRVSVMATEGLQARGAAILAASIVAQTPTIEIVDVSPLALGVQRVGTRDVTVVAPANIRIPFHRESLLFASSQQTDIVYRVLESRHVRQLAPSTNGKLSAAHCIGNIRLTRASLGTAGTPTQLVTKLQIRFDVDIDLQLSATITDLTTRQFDHTIFTGDDAVLPRPIVTRIQQQLATLFGCHRQIEQAEETDTASIENATDETEQSGSNGTSPNDETTAAAPQTLQQYARDLQSMVATNKIVISISDDEKSKLSRKLEETLQWLQQPTASSNAHNENLATPQPLSIDSDACAARVKSLRRLHLSIVASEAIAQLRQLDE